MKSFKFLLLSLLCVLSQSVTVSAQILTSEIEVRTGPTVIEDAAEFPAGLTASSITSNSVSGGSYTNQSGGAANFPAGIISDKLEGDIVEWQNFAEGEEKPIYTNLTQGIYLLTIRGRGASHAYSTFIIHCYDSHNKGGQRLFNTGYYSEWIVGWDQVQYDGWNNFSIRAKASKGMQGRFSLIRLN